MELNEREKNIVKLINNLSEVADNEATTQEAIDRILGQIKRETAENIKAEMQEAEKPRTPTVEFPQQEMADAMRAAISDEKMRMMGEISDEFDKGRSQQALQNMGRLLFTRVREVKVPCKAHLTDAGIDFFVPDEKAWTDEFKETVKKYSKNKVYDGVDGVEFQDKRLIVKPGAHVAIPSGIKTIIPQGLAMMMVNKSGVATKLKLDHSACLIDSEYRDELIFCFFNHNHMEPVEITPGMKLTQGLIVPVINLELTEVLNCVYEDMGKDTNRGGGFGSTDKK